MSSEKNTWNKPEHLAPLLAALGDLSAWLLAEQVAGVVIGGVAASILGRPRLTRDVDALVLLDEGKWADFLAAGEQFGFKPRLADALVFARKARVLLVQHESSGIDLDLVFGNLPFEKEAVARAEWVEVGGIRVPLPVPEDLIIMKAVAHRPRDLSDIGSLLDSHPKLDIRKIKQWVQEFSEALEMPEIMSDMESLLSKHRKKE
ncbi:MAG: nucleotidyltransferase [bacterium]